MTEDNTDLPFQRIEEESPSLPIAGIQHFNFCRRRWALIYMERQWVDNVHTIAGDIFHENAHNGIGSEKRGSTIITHGLEIFSRILNIHGVCDVAEFHLDPNGVKLFGRDGLWQPVPVEYKKGRPTAITSDSLQLCAQALCLEEMLCTHIPVAYLYYGEYRRRTEIPLNDELRSKVVSITMEMHQLYDRHHMPKVKSGKYCKDCSMSGVCLPVLCENKPVADYITKHF